MEHQLKKQKTVHQTQTKTSQNQQQTISSADLIQAITSNVFQHSDSSGYLVSPLNLLSPLLILLNGSAEKSRMELARFFGFQRNPTQEELQQLNKMVLKHFNYLSSNTTSLKLSNACIVKNSFYLKEEFKSLVESHGNLIHKDFSDPGAIVKFINTMIEEQTNNKIHGLLSDDDITEDTQMVITSALHLKTDWIHQFEAEDIFPLEFTNVLTDVKQTRDFICDKRSCFYIEQPTFKMVRLDCRDGFSVAFILPNLTKDMTPEEYDAVLHEKYDLRKYMSGGILNQSNRHHISLKFPKFKVENKVTLNDNLQKNKVCDIFSSNDADFTNMYNRADCNGRNLYVGIVKHKTMFEVTETGIEGAAATAVTMLLESYMMPPPAPKKQFHATRTFRYQVLYNCDTVVFDGVYSGE